MNINKELFLKYVRNYILVVLLITILLLPVYYTIYASAKDIIIGNAQGNLDLVTEELDDRISRMQGFTDVVRDNEYVAKIAAMQGIPNIEDYYTLWKGMEVVSNNLLVGLGDTVWYTLFRDNTVVLSGRNALTDPQTQNYEYYTYPGENFESWKELIFAGMEKIRFFPAAEILVENNRKTNAIMCVIKGPGIVEGYDMASVFLIDVSEWGEGMMNREKDFLYVQDAEGQVLFQSRDIREELNGKEIQRNMNINGARYTVLKRESLVNGLQVVVGISDDTIMGQISGINKILWVYLILAMLGILIAGIGFAAQKALQMQKLLKNLKYEEKSGKLRNEYNFISDAVKEMWENNRKYQEELQNMKNSVRNSLLERLLTKGIYSDQEKEKVLGYLEWRMEFYCVACVRGDGMERDYSHTFLFLNQYLDNCCTCISVSTSMNEQTYIICMDEDGSPDVKAVKAVFEKAVEGNRDLTVGISGIGTGLDNLQQCYQQASWMNRWVSRDIGSGVQIYGGDKDFTGKQNFYHQLERYNLNSRLNDYLVLGEEESVNKIFERICGMMRRCSDVTEQEIMQLFFEMRMPIVRIWREFDMEGEPVSYTSGTNILKLLEELQDSARLICRKVTGKKKEKEESKKREMVAFVDQHYMEPEMCVSYMADQFGISEKYFISCFKEEARKGFSAYVEEKRLCLAEDYLLNSDENMNRISALVGYNTVDAFYKSFRKNYGMAPGKWREGKRKKM